MIAARRCLLLSIAVLVALLPFSAVSAAHHKPSIEVVASGLDNPRGLDFGHWGALYVTEAGRGGDGPCIAGAEGDVCAGASGAVTKIWKGGQKRVLSGLPSLASAEDGSGALGPQDISFGHWSAYLVVGLGQNPAARAGLGPLGPSFGQLYRISHHGDVRAVADISAYEAAENPDGVEPPDSNPNSVLALHHKRLVVDAGGNSLLRVGHRGSISTVAVFPPQDMTQAVPTAVVQGPDGAYYVSQLTGFPFPAGAANVYRVEPGSEPEVYAEGFTNITDLAFGPDGSLYVVEFATNGILSGDPAGALKKVAPDGSQETVVSEGLVAPTGVAVSHHGDVYVSNFGAAAGIGEVVRVRP